jgi:23S rRNA pseudouridine1911/1915/1917 synthase
MAAIGHPVCGDRQYGGTPSGRRLGLTRQFLHSARLRFSHPVSGADTCCESKPPAELRQIQSVARREPVSGGPDGGYSYE